MAKVINKSMRNFLSPVLNTVDISDKELDKLRGVIDKAEYDCCSIVAIYWINDGSFSKATPVAYQIQFKDGDGNVVAQTSTLKSSPQKLKLPVGEYIICNNVISEVTNTLPGSGFTINGSNNYSLSDAETIGTHCDSSSTTLAGAYFVYSNDGSPI